VSSREPRLCEHARSVSRDELGIAAAGFRGFTVRGLVE
jgi:hypothetical protein